MEFADITQVKTNFPDMYNNPVDVKCIFSLDIESEKEAKRLGGIENYLSVYRKI